MGDRPLRPLRAGDLVAAHRRRPPVDSPKCELPHRKVEEVDTRLWRAICELVEQPDLVEEIAAARRGRAHADTREWQKDVTEYEGKLAKLGRAETTILSRFRQGLVSESAMDASLAEGSRQRAMLERQLDAARRAIADAGKAKANVAALETVLRDLRAKVRVATPVERYALVQLLVEPGGIVLGTFEISARVGLQAPSQKVGSGAQAA